MPKKISNPKYYTVSMTLPDGSRKFYKARTKKEAEAKRDRDKLRVGKGLKIGEKIRFRDLAETWLTLKQGTVSIRTEDTIRGTLDRYILPFFGDMYVEDIRPLNVQFFLKSMSDYSHSTQSKALQTVNAVFRLARDNNYIERIPITSDTKPGGAKTKEVIPLTDEQCETLLTAMKGTRVYPFLMVLRFAGLRRGEALGLMWNDIDFDAHTLTVNRSIIFSSTNRNQGEINLNCKTDAAHRTIPMIPELEAVLKEEKDKSKSIYVFSGKNGKFLSDTSFKRMWQLISYRTVGGMGSETDVRSLDRPIDFEVHPHLLRHTCITSWIRGGVLPKTAQYLAGHASIEITMNIYNHYLQEMDHDITVASMLNATPKFAASL